ncbi:MAG: hypothetical protein AB1758_08480, partial [Candidatus Eremiobacterota bacterium]
GAGRSASELVGVARSAGAQKAAQAARELERIDPQRPWDEKSRYYHAAWRLARVGDPEAGGALEIYRRLLVLSPDQAEQLAGLAEQGCFRLTPEGCWKPYRGGWSDSPDRPYEPKQTGNLTSSPLSLQGLKGSRVTFEGQWKLEDGYDYVQLEVARGGKDWAPLEKFTGEQARGPVTVDLSPCDGQTVSLRWRFGCDGSTEKDGFELWNPAVEATEAASGRKVVLGGCAQEPERFRQRLVEVVLNGPRPTEALAALAQTVSELKNPEPAIELLERLSADAPNFEARRAALSELTRLLGSQAALAVEPSDAGRARELAAVKALCDELGDPARVVAAWSALAPDRRDPDLEGRARLVGWLARSQEPSRAAEVARRIQGDGLSWADRRPLLEAACLLGSGVAGYQKLATAGIDAAGARKLATLAGQLSRHWTPEGAWGLEGVPGWGEVWSDSPGGRYASSQDCDLTSSVLSLKGLSHPRLRLEADCDTESGYDKVTLQGRAPGGEWRNLAEFSGEFQRSPHEVNLSPLEAAEIQLRMRFHSDNSTEGEGFRFRDCRLVGDGGAELRMAMAAVSAELRARFLDKAAGPGCGALCDLAGEVGPEGALLLWGVLEPELGKPDFEATRQAMVELVSAVGTEALRRWPDFLEGTGPERLRKARSYRAAVGLSQALGRPAEGFYERLRAVELTGPTVDHMVALARPEAFEACLALATEEGRSPEERERTLAMLASLEKGPELLAALEVALSTGRLQGRLLGPIVEQAARLSVVGASPAQALDQAMSSATGIEERDDQVIVGGVVVKRRQD